MRKITKSLLALALLFGVVGGAKAQTETDLKDLEAANGTTEAWVASIPATYPIDVKDVTIFGSDASSQTTNANVNKYDYIYFEVTNFATAHPVRIFFWDPTANARKDWYIKPVEGKESVTDWSVRTDVTGNGTYCVKIPTGARLQGAKGPWTSSATDVAYFQFSKMYVIEPTDPLAVPKANLQIVIDLGNAQSSFAKTAASFQVLTDAITAAQAEILKSSPETDETKLSNAGTAITDAINGFVYQDGYTKLTKGMANNNVDYALNASTGLPYGTSGVDMNTYAELNEFDQFIVLTSAGKPRYCMNRKTSSGQIGADLASSEMIDINPNNGNTWATEKYQTIDENKFTLDIKAIAADWDGLARLNCIKGANYSNVTVTDMLLYRTLTVGDAKFATFGSLYKNAKLNSVTAYAAKYSAGKVTLTEVTNVPAGKGVVVEAAAAGSYAPTFDVAADDIDTDLQVSNGTVTGDGSTIFVLANGGSGVGFYKLADGEKVPAGKAYLVIPASARDFIGFADEATGISTSLMNNGKVNNEVFNLKGQRVSQPTKGLYIVNGKKVVIK